MTIPLITKPVLSAGGRRYVRLDPQAAFTRARNTAAQVNSGELPMLQRSRYQRIVTGHHDSAAADTVRKAYSRTRKALPHADILQFDEYYSTATGFVYSQEGTRQKQPFDMVARGQAIAAGIQRAQDCLEPPEFKAAVLQVPYDHRTDIPDLINADYYRLHGALPVHRQPLLNAAYEHSTGLRWGLPGRIGRDHRIPGHFRWRQDTPIDRAIGIASLYPNISAYMSRDDYRRHVLDMSGESSASYKHHFNRLRSESALFDQLLLTACENRVTGRSSAPSFSQPLLQRIIWEYRRAYHYGNDQRHAWQDTSQRLALREMQTHDETHYLRGAAFVHNAWHIANTVLQPEQCLSPRDFMQGALGLLDGQSKIEKVYARERRALPREQRPLLDAAYARATGYRFTFRNKWPQPLQSHFRWSPPEWSIVDRAQLLSVIAQRGHTRFTPTEFDEFVLGRVYKTKIGRNTAMLRRFYSLPENERSQLNNSAVLASGQIITGDRTAIRWNAPTDWFDARRESALFMLEVRRVLWHGQQLMPNRHRDLHLYLGLE